MARVHKCYRYKRYCKASSCSFLLISKQDLESIGTIFQLITEARLMRQCFDDSPSLSLSLSLSPLQENSLNCARIKQSSVDVRSRSIRFIILIIFQVLNASIALSRRRPPGMLYALSQWRKRNAVMVASATCVLHDITPVALCSIAVLEETAFAGKSHKAWGLFHDVQSIVVENWNQSSVGWRIVGGGPIPDHKCCARRGRLHVVHKDTVENVNELANER